MRGNLQHVETVTVIRPSSSWFDLNITELWRYRDLIGMLVWRDFVAVYKQTILGPLWYILQPLLTTLVFVVVFGNIAGISTDRIPPFLFYLSGVVVWNYFSSCVTSTANTFTNNANIFGKVYFPRLVIPLAVVISNLIAFLIQLALFVGVLGYFIFRGAPVGVTPTVGFLPLLIVQMALMGLGTGVIVSSLTTRYRDLACLVTFGVQLWMFATPVVYPASTVSPRWQWVLLANPMASVVEYFRAGFLGTGGHDVFHLGLSLAMTLLLLVVGLLLFNRVEKTFMDTV